MLEHCARTHEVEPFFDDRLSAEAAIDLRGHLAGCAACTQAHTALFQMRAALRETADAPNAFVMKRARRELLEKVGSTARPMLRSHGRRNHGRLAALSALVAVLASIIGLVVWLAAPAAPATTNVVVTAASGAQFSRENSGSHQIVRLTDGEFDFDVQEHPGGLRLLVMVPDGEIEDIGTRFRVVVKNGVTTEVSVSDGEVELRKHGAAPLRLIAGMTYRPAAPEAPASAIAPNPEPIAVPSVAASAAIGGAARAASPTRSSGPSVQSAVPSSHASASAPGGATAEDAAYMAVVRMLREGRRDEARAAAKAYLRDFPDGLRRAEMGAVSGGN
jgi:ferric-dicitrate binding protein FerR (iron transport regulator)